MQIILTNLMLTNSHKTTPKSPKIFFLNSQLWDLIDLGFAQGPQAHYLPLSPILYTLDPPKIHRNPSKAPQIPQKNKYEAEWGGSNILIPHTTSSIAWSLISLRLFSYTVSLRPVSPDTLFPRDQIHQLQFPWDQLIHLHSFPDTSFSSYTVSSRLVSPSTQFPWD